MLHHTRGKILLSRSPGSQLNKASPEFGGGFTKDDRADDQLHHQTVVLVASAPIAFPIGLDHSRGDPSPTTSRGGKGHLIDAMAGPTPVHEKDIAFNEDVPLLIHVPGSISALDLVPVLVSPDTIRKLRRQPGRADGVEAPERLSGERGIGSHHAIIWKHHSNRTVDCLQEQATWVEGALSRLPDASAASRTAALQGSFATTSDSLIDLSRGNPAALVLRSERCRARASHSVFSSSARKPR